MLRSDHDPAPQNPWYQKRPVCGASIGAYLPDEGHLQPASFGGVILVDDKPYGLTVHHMLEPPSDHEDDGEEHDSTDDSSESQSESGTSDIESVSSHGEQATRSSARAGKLNLPSRARRFLQYRHRSRSSSSSEDSSSSSSDIDDADNETGEETYSSSEFESDVSDNVSPTRNRSTNTSTSRPSEPGDTAGFPIDSTRDLAITQPALVDAVNTGWHPQDIPQEEQDDDHLLSFKLGRVYASSGLRRVAVGQDANGSGSRMSARCEVDWALIELDESRLQSENLILGGRRCLKASSSSRSKASSLKEPNTRPTTTHLDTSESTTALSSQTADLHPTHLLHPSSFPNTPVLSLSRTSGLQTGTVGACMSLLKLRGRCTFSASWTVVGASFGAGGDSGAWVVEARAVNGNRNADQAAVAVAGHVVARHESVGITYFCPLGVVFEDIARVLGVRREKMKLPGELEVGAEEERPKIGTGSGVVVVNQSIEAEAEGGAADIEVTTPDTTETPKDIADVLDAMRIERGGREKHTAVRSRVRGLGYKTCAHERQQAQATAS